ncbi:MAG TPA: SRPBCC domain-containing protein [Caulobacteraceae bacterium]|nr:SRPBCC domain-containing protein [Caulobacteraceae bacterium]
MATTTDAAKLERAITLTRRFAAPRALVFRALTDPEHLMRWWGPNGFTTPECTIDLRVGGAMRIVMQGFDGGRFPMTAVIDALNPPERLGYAFEAYIDAGGPAVRGHNLIVLSEVDGHTELRLIARGEGLRPEAAFMLQGMKPGWSQSLERLAALFV